MLYPIVGGLLIGLSATVLMLLLGRIAGASGIYFNALEVRNKKQLVDSLWCWAFIAGIVIIVPIVHYFLPIPIPERPSGSAALAILAGLLVGAGTKLGSGCTSGHGVCGLSRLSLRSLFATGTFMLSGMITVFIMRSFS
ncbi:MAG: YeeE/YedE family protein [Sinobacterium sp.]|nr:YeeE/YedE family protein [Sinobacterium sp.]